MTKEEIEKTFVSSASQDELFDAFQSAIEQKLDDPDLYRLLLWNKVLSADEIFMYAAKISKVFPQFSYRIYYWSGNIFESASVYNEYIDKAFISYKKASEISPDETNPYLSSLKMYNAELDLPPLKELLSYVDSGIKNVPAKSKLCMEAAAICRKAGNKGKEVYYKEAGAAYQKRGL